MAQVERERLCDVALAVGEDQPTLCGEWSVKELVVHLLLRERSPAAAFLPVPRLHGVIDAEMGRIGRERFEVLVERLRGGPPVWSPYAVPKLDAVANTLEFYVHHEDIRRAQPGWEPRDLAAEEQKLLWSMIRRAGKAFTLKSPSGLVLENAVTGSRAVLQDRTPMVTVRGEPSELVLFCFGRQEQAHVELDGPSDAVDGVRAAAFGA